MDARGMDAPPLANPVFEGSEKRLEVHFQPARTAGAAPGGLRTLSRATLDALMALAACEIVSGISNEQFDAYVLSESSLFVYSATWVLKTCGSTQLLNCLERLFDEADKLGMKATAVRYSRASFLFPDKQPALHRTFDSEVAYLRPLLANIGNGGSAFVLGDMLHGLQWHLVTACDTSAPRPAPGTRPPDVTCDRPGALTRARAGCAALRRPSEGAAGGGSEVEARYTLEVAMTELDVDAAKHFVRDSDFVSSAHTTTASGIRDLVPDATLDDYVFEPCGYSMNGILGSGYVTIHVTPEDAFSYASCELHGFPSTSFSPVTMVASIARIFRPGRLTVMCSMDTGSAVAAGDEHWAAYLVLDGYGCAGATCQALPGGGRAWLFSLVRDGFVRCPRTLSSPAVLPAWPRFGGRPGPRGSLTLSDPLLARHKAAVGDVRAGPYSRVPRGDGDTASSSSDLVVDEVPTRSVSPESPTGSDALLARLGVVHMDRTCATAKAVLARDVLRREEVTDSFMLVDVGAVSHALAAWCDAAPRVCALVHAAVAADAAVTSLFASRGALFGVELSRDVDALVPLAPTRNLAMLRPIKRPRDIRAAAARGVRCFAADTPAELAKVQRQAPDAAVLLAVPAGRGARDTARALAAAALAAGVPIGGVCVRVPSELGAHEACAAARRAVDGLADAGHDAHWLHLEVGARELPCALAQSLQNAFPALQFPFLRLSVQADAMCRAVATLVTQVHACRRDEWHVADLPSEMLEASTVQPVADTHAAPVCPTATVLSDGSRQLTVRVGDLQVGDWLLFDSVGLPASSADLEVIYVAPRPAAQPVTSSSQ